MIVNVMATKGKLPLSCSSNSSAPSSPSSSQQHKSQFTAALPQTQIYENKHQHQHRHQVGSTPNWPGNKFEYGPEKEGDPTCRFNDNLELTDIDEDKPAESAPAVVREIQKEHMFYKAVTPSDVGKLNRLVIPKQHAEKYFPLDSSSNEKGLILNFEDRNGKSWRFRYSYWNSSQSYVMTKGWSRFVKDKKLDAGDIVYFQRGAGDLGKDRLYIDWRRRLDAPDPTTACYQLYCQQQQHQKQQPYSSITPWSPLLMRPPPPTARLLARDPLHLFNLPPDRNAYHGGGSGSYSHSCSNYSNGVKVNPCSSFGTPTFYNMRPAGPAPRQQGGGGCGEPMPMVYESVPAVVQGKAAAAAKSLRLFGVNMVCPITTDQSNVDPCDELSSSNTIPPHATPQELPYQQPDPHVMSTYPPHELRLYNATPFPPIPVPADLLDKRKSSVSLDLDI